MNAEPASADPSARSHLPRRAAAWAWDAIFSLGEEMDGGLVRLPYTQADLSSHFGWPRNDGRVAAYLRGLGPVVVCRTGGIVLDRGLLASLAPPDSRPCARDRSPGASERALYLVSGARNDQDLGGPSGPGQDELLRRLAALDEQLLDVLWEQRSVMRALLDRPNAKSGSEPVIESAQQPRPEAIGSAKGRGRTRNEAREEKGVLVPEVKNQTHTSLSSLSGKPRNAAADADTSGQPRSSDRDWHDAELPELLGELLAVCNERGFPGLNNPSLAAVALSAYTRTQISHAQRELARQVRSGQRFTSPIGVLVNAARTAHVGYFPASVSPGVRCLGRAEPGEAHSTQGACPVVVDQEDPVDDEAVAAVGALNVEALQALDDAVGAHVRGLLGEAMATNALRSPGTLTYWRPILWRARHQPSPTAEEQR